MSLANRMPTRLRNRLGSAVESHIYQDRLISAGGDVYVPGPLQRLTLTVSRAAVERGRTPPWVWSRDHCRDFWALSDHTGTGNAPIYYAGKSTTVVDAMDTFWSPEVHPGQSVLEVGCNAGGNLNALHAKSFNALAGVEISNEALAELGRSFPKLHDAATLHQGSAEDVLPRLANDSVDVVFSMAVLLHIHPSSHVVLEHMVRIARSYVCVIEAEHCLCGYVFPRNYRRVFERLGCEQIREETLTRRTHPDVSVDYLGYTARLFRTPSR